MVAALSVAAIGTACSAHHDPAPGALLLAIDSNLKVPDDLDEIGVSVASADGTSLTTDKQYPMAPTGAAKLPATLAIVRGTSAPIDIKVAGFKNGQAFALREMVTTIPEDRTAILRVDLNWLDNHSTSSTGESVRSLTGNCAAGDTSVAGSCVSFTLDSAALDRYSADAIVASDGDACVDVDACMTATSASSVSVPVAALARGTEGDGGASCGLPSPGIAGPYNVGLVLAAGADGWCDGQRCVIPLEQDPVEGWTPDGAGGITLPPSVCTNAKIVSVLLTPTSGSCPSYTATHPACQSYGGEAGAGSEAGPPPGDAGIDATVDAGMDADAADANFTSKSVVLPDPIVALAGDVGDQNIVGFLGAAGAPASLVAFRGDNLDRLVYPPMQLAGIPVSSSLTVAAAAGVVACSFPGMLDLLTVPGLTDAGSYPTGTYTAANLTYGPSADGGSVLAFDESSNLLWIVPGTDQTMTATLTGNATALAYEPTSARFAVATKPFTGGLDMIQIGPLSTTFATASPTVEQPFSATSMAFADANTLVWWVTDANAAQHMYSAATTATNDPGTEVKQASALGLSSGASSMVGGGGRVFWIGNDHHIDELHFAAGASSGVVTDVSTSLATSTTVAQLSLSAANLVFGDSSATLYRYALGELP
jgi:hypothetical protein